MFFLASWGLHNKENAMFEHFRFIFLWHGDAVDVKIHVKFNKIYPWHTEHRLYYQLGNKALAPLQVSFGACSRPQTTKIAQNFLKSWHEHMDMNWSSYAFSISKDDTNRANVLISLDVCSDVSFIINFSMIVPPLFLNICEWMILLKSFFMAPRSHKS